MSCNNRCNKRPESCGCQFNIKTFGVGDITKITFDGSDPTKLNWNEISIPEVVSVPVLKPDIEHLDQVYVEASINTAKLIETPFAYTSYDRQATAYEITSATAAIATANISITTIQADVTTILGIVGLPALPEVAQLQVAMAAVTAAHTSLTTAITKATTALGTACVLAVTVVADLNSIIEALTVLQAALNALIVAGNNLVTATASSSASSSVKAQVLADVTILLTDIATATTNITTATVALNGAITVIGYTKVFVINSNAEGTCLSGRKLVLEGVLKQKVVYTALVDCQSVHSFCNQIPFSAYVIPYASFVGLTYSENITVVENAATPCVTTTVNGYLYDPNTPIVVNLCEDFCVSSAIEDIFAYAVDKRNVFKNITLFLWATPTVTVNG